MGKKKAKQPTIGRKYDGLLSFVSELLEQAQRTSARAVNAVMTATYWEVGQRIVEFEQQGQIRADYGDAVIKQLSLDLTKRFGRGFGPVNLSQMRKFYGLWPEHRIFQTVSEKSERTTGVNIFHTPSEISPALSAQSGIQQTPSGKSAISQTLSAKFSLANLAQAFPLPWSHYVRLLSVDNPEARNFYETEAIRGGWSVRGENNEDEDCFRSCITT